MMSMLTNAADTLLRAVVPKASAAAATCCNWDLRWEMCYCSGGLRYSHQCRYNLRPAGCTVCGFPERCGFCQVVGTC